MKTVGSNCKTLLASAEFQEALQRIGDVKRFGRNCVLFRVGDLNDGVFLVLKGKVCLRVPSVIKLDRVFQAGSVLGLPSTFSGNPYSLTAFSIAGCQVIHVARHRFLELMAVRSDCCREAVELLSREAAFIFSAYRDYRTLPIQQTTRNGHGEKRIGAAGVAQVRC